MKRLILLIGFVLSLPSLFAQDFPITIPAVKKQVEEVSVNNTQLLNDPNYFDNFKKGFSLYQSKLNFQPQFILDKTLPEEGYRIDFKGSKKNIYVSSIKGAFYSGVTYGQLISFGLEENRSFALEDQPRFSYRGLMLDVSRHFIPKSEVLRVIDAMAMVKLNKLHLHLVDDNGWRIEIKKYPKLTEVGAARPTKYNQLYYPNRPNTTEQDTTYNTGFFTQEDLKEIVAYAQDRGIDVIPEIEMPAHTVSALAAYPDLACATAPKPILVPSGAGGPAIEVIYCAGKESVYSFIEDVLREVMAIFPYPVIHLGGDEAIKTHWKTCPNCNSKMKELGLNNYEELQSYFMSRINRFLIENNKTSMAWDEVTNGPIPKDMIVVGWRGRGLHALKAVKQGHQVVMCPAIPMYFIRYQGPQWMEPYTYFGNNTLKDAFFYEPYGKEWEGQDKSLLLGIQGALWTEFATNTHEVEHQLFPRVFALGHVAWAKPDQKDWKEFLDGVDELSKILRYRGYEVALSAQNIFHKVTSLNSEKLQVELACEDPRTTIRYDIFPEDYYSKPIPQPEKESFEERSQTYSQPFTINPGEIVKATTYIDTQRRGQMLIIPTINHLGIGANILNSNKQADFSKVINGVRGSYKVTDGEWIGPISTGESLSFCMKLAEPRSINTVALGFGVNNGMTMYLPSEIKVELYQDETATSPVASFTKTLDQDEMFPQKVGRTPFSVPFDGISVQVIKIYLKAPLTTPDGFIKEGTPARFYLDEIEVY